MSSPDHTPQPEGPESPAVDAVVFTPTDNAPLPFVTRGIALAAESPLHVVTAEGETGEQPGREVTIPTGFLAAGIIHPIRVRKIFATGTTVTQVLILR
jgi:hypothetical protein